MRSFCVLTARAVYTVLLAFSIVVSLASAQQAQGLVGRWKMISTTESGDTVNWTLLMKQDGMTWSATVSSQEGEAPAKELKVDGESVHMKTPYNGATYDIDLKLEGDKLTGKWSGNGDSGLTKGTRASESPATK